MNICGKLLQKQQNISDYPGVTITFLGDSVTQGCFEAYLEDDATIATVFDQENGYHHHLAHMLSVLYPAVPINIINSGISGGTAPHGLERLERDVLRYSPDLVVVCFGLNDAMAGTEGLQRYLDAMDSILTRLQYENVETIFMTPNMMCTRIDPSITNPAIANTARAVCRIQTEGVLDTYIQGARDLCARRNVVLCDCYRKWQMLHQNGVDITNLLSNRINHPTKEMNKLFAVSLLETILYKE